MPKIAEWHWPQQIVRIYILGLILCDIQGFFALQERSLNSVTDNHSQFEKENFEFSRYKRISKNSDSRAFTRHSSIEARQLKPYEEVTYNERTTNLGRKKIESIISREAKDDNKRNFGRGQIITERKYHNRRSESIRENLARGANERRSESRDGRQQIVAERRDVDNRRSESRERLARGAIERRLESRESRRRIVAERRDVDNRRSESRERLARGVNEHRLESREGRRQIVAERRDGDNRRSESRERLARGDNEHRLESREGRRQIVAERRDVDNRRSESRERLASGANERRLESRDGRRQIVAERRDVGNRHSERRELLARGANERRLETSKIESKPFVDDRRNEIYIPTLEFYTLSPKRSDLFYESQDYSAYFPNLFKNVFGMQSSFSKAIREPMEVVETSLLVCALYMILTNLLPATSKTDYNGSSFSFQRFLVTS